MTMKARKPRKKHLSIGNIVFDDEPALHAEVTRLMQEEARVFNRMVLEGLKLFITNRT